MEEYSLSSSSIEAIVAATIAERERLRSSDQWRSWLSTIGSFASDLDVWELLDPNVSDEQLKKLIEKPTKPSFPSEPLTEVTELHVIPQLKL